MQQQDERRQQDHVVLFQNALDEKYDSKTEIDQSLLRQLRDQHRGDKENVTQTLFTILSCPESSSSKLTFSLSRTLVQHSHGDDHQKNILACCALIRALANRRAFVAMEAFVRHMLPPHLQTCTVYSTAMAALTTTRELHHNQQQQEQSPHHVHRIRPHEKQSARALRLWIDMRRLGLAPTSYTLTALFRAMNGPQQVWDICTQIRGHRCQENQHNISGGGIGSSRNSSPWTRPVYEAAIRACARDTAQQSSRMAWDTALQIWQWMRDDKNNNATIQPTVDTYSALFQVCAASGNVTAALHLLDHEILVDAGSSKSLNGAEQTRRRVQKHPRLWDAILNVCVSSRDDATCLHLLHRMHNEMEVQPNVHHCTAYLKCLSLAKEDVQAVDFVMNTMMMNIPSSPKAATGYDSIHDSHNPRLQTAPPDLVAIHTALAACASTRNYKMARQLFDSVVQHYRHSGQDSHGINNMVVRPNQQTYHWLLAACQNGQQARDVIREMRLSRRHRPRGRALIGTTTRHVVVPPSIISYTKAIVACRQVGDLETALWLLQTAILDDGLEPDVYIYSAVIWTAAAAKDWKKARALVEEMKSRGCRPAIISYNGLLAALSEASCNDNHCDEHRFELALAVLDDIHHDGLVSTKRTFSQLARLATITASGTDQQRRLARLEQIYHEKMTVDEKKEVSIGGPILQALMNAYGAHGQYLQARKIFDAISSTRNDIGCVRAILFACGTAKPRPAWQQALVILHATNCTITSVSWGSEARIIVLPSSTDATSVSSAMLACSKADQWQESLKLWRAFTDDDGGDKRDHASISLLALNSLIAACGRHGHSST
jgi:pentatricopeptide repeat protein